MAKCFITKLQGIITNDTLPKIGELVINFPKEDTPTKYNRGLVLKASSNINVRVSGGSFCSEDLVPNGKTSIVIPSQTQTTLYVENKDCIVFVNANYNLLLLNLGTIENHGTSKSSFDISNLKYNRPDFNTIYCVNSKFYGDISAFKGALNLVHMYMSNCDGIKGDISVFANTPISSLTFENTGVSGDVASLSNCNNLIEVRFTNDTKIYGDISAFGNKQILDILFLENTSCYGDVSTLNNCNRLKELRIKNVLNISGELSQLGSNLIFFTATGTSKVFTWKNTRPSSSKIIALEDVNLGDDVDNCLKNLSGCTSGINGGEAAWYKTIKIYGNRTSASDAAVATLQQKGYTVSVTPA